MLDYSWKVKSLLLKSLEKKDLLTVDILKFVASGGGYVRHCEEIAPLNVLYDKYGKEVVESRIADLAKDEIITDHVVKHKDERILMWGIYKTPSEATSLKIGATPFRHALSNEIGQIILAKMPEIKAKMSEYWQRYPHGAIMKLTQDSRWNEWSIENFAKAFGEREFQEAIEDLVREEIIFRHQYRSQEHNYVYLRSFPGVFYEVAPREDITRDVEHSRYAQDYED